MNNVNLIGRLTKEAELRYTTTGKAVATFTLAVRRSYKNSKGEYEADFVRCVVWDKQAENVANYVKKGHQIALNGEISTRSFEGQDGKMNYITEVLCHRIEFLEKKEQEEKKGRQTA